MLRLVLTHISIGKSEMVSIVYMDISHNLTWFYWTIATGVASKQKVTTLHVHLVSPQNIYVFWIRNCSDAKSRSYIGVLVLFEFWDWLRIDTSWIFISANCNTGIVCRNGGFIGPNCACVCPFGLSGRDCTEVVQGTSGIKRQ